MRVARPLVSLFAIQAGCLLGVSQGRAQEPAVANYPLLPPTLATAPSAQAISQGPALPSQQSQDFRSQGGNAALARLRNPFDAGGPPPKRGLFGHAGPQRLPAGDVPPAPTGFAPGSVAAPGMNAPAGTAGAPGSGTAPGSGAAAAPGAAGADAFAAAAGDAGAGFGGGPQSPTQDFAMIGDQSPFRFHSFQAGDGNPQPPPVPGPRAASIFYPTVRSFKIAENMSPRPQDRVFFNFNYYNNLNDTINTRDRVPINHIQAFRYLFGWEQTFNQGKGSIGVRVPINNVTGDSNLATGNPGTSVRVPSSTAMGNLSVFAKYILEQNPRTGSLASVGLAITAPTGPGRFAGAPWLFGLNDVTIQPFFGYIYNYGNWYVQGFSAFDFPSTVRDVTLMYNDVGLGYYLIRSQEPGRFLTALAPTFELHVNTPFTHRDWKNRFDIAGSPDVVNLTYGLNFQFYGTATLTTALITPVSSPQPFNTEFAVLLNFFYGRSRSALPLTPPAL